MNQQWQSKDPKLPPHAHKKELTKGSGGGRWRERGMGGGGEKERKNQIEKRKERKQDYYLIKAGTFAYLGRDDIATKVQSERRYWSTKSWNREGVYKYGGGTSLPPTVERL